MRSPASITRCFAISPTIGKFKDLSAGRGSQEIAGSYVLGAWAENSLFFEPIGRKQGAVKVEPQCKDLPPAPGSACGSTVKDRHTIRPLIRLYAEELSKGSAAEEWKERVYEAIATMPPPGVTVKQLMAALKPRRRPFGGRLTCSWMRNASWTPAS